MISSPLRRIFTYWVDAPGKTLPGYLELCLQTWQDHLPGTEIVLLTHQNLHEWIGDPIDMRTFKTLSLPHQSDVASFLVLAQHGGVFFDMDTVVLGNAAEHLAHLDPRKVHFFGKHEPRALHIGMIAALQANHPLMLALAARERELLAAEQWRQERVDFEAPRQHWSWWGNAVIYEVTDWRNGRPGNELWETVNLIDRVSTGALLEATYPSSGDAAYDYQAMYFDDRGPSAIDMVDRVKMGIVCLHNSWTPEIYRDLTVDQVVNVDVPLTRLLLHALSHRLDTAAV